MKTLFLALCATAAFHTTFAQMMPSHQTIRTPYGNRTITTHSPGYRPSFFGGEGKYEFTIIMKDDSTFVSWTKINDTESKHSVTIKDADNNKKTIYPTDTKGLIRIDESGNELYGIPTDSCWLFQTASGRINSFSYLAQPGMEYVIAIQYGDEGRIVPLNKKNLLRIAGNDPKVVKLIEQGRFIRAIKAFNKKEDLESEDE